MSRAVWLVARREFDARVRTRSFVIGTFVVALLLVGFAFAEHPAGDGDRPSVIGLNGQAISVTEQLVAEAGQVGREVRTVEVTDLAAGREQVANGTLDALLSGAPAALTVLVNHTLDDELRGVLNGLVRQQVLRGQLAAMEDTAALDVDGILRTVTEAHVTVRTLSPADTTHAARLSVALVVVALLYLALLVYGSLVAVGVFEERTNRVVGFLLPAVRPRRLLAGTVAGLGLAGLVQLAAVGVVGLVAAWVAGVLPSVGVAVAALAWGLLWYVLGFLLYATMFAAAGALVARQENLLPAIAALLVACVLGFALLAMNPTGATTTVLSIVPLFSPILMPGRLALGGVPFWQVLLALVLTAALVAVLFRAGGWIYQKSLLRNA